MLSINLWQQTQALPLNTIFSKGLFVIPKRTKNTSKASKLISWALTQPCKINSESYLIGCGNQLNSKAEAMVGLSYHYCQVEVQNNFKAFFRHTKYAGTAY
jgi:hypothetical protein